MPSAMISTMSSVYWICSGWHGLYFLIDEGSTFNIVVILDGVSACLVLFLDSSAKSLQSSSCFPG